MKLINTIPDNLLSAERIAIDIETQSKDKTEDDTFTPDFYQDMILSVQLYDGQEVYIIDWREVNTDTEEKMRTILMDQAILKVAHNGLFDFGMLCRTLNSKVISVYDTLIVERLIYMHYSKDANAHVLGKRLVDLLERRVGKSKDSAVVQSFADHEGPFTPEQLKYMAADVIYLFDIIKSQARDIEQLGLEQTVKLENAFLPVVVDMVLKGVEFDMDLWESYVPQINTIIQQFRDQAIEYVKPFMHYVPYNVRGAGKKLLSRNDIPLFYCDAENYQLYDGDEANEFFTNRYKQAGEPKTDERIDELKNVYTYEHKYVEPTDSGYKLTLKINSPKQLQECFNDLGFSVPSTSKEVLPDYFHLHPILELITEWRRWRNMLGKGKGWIREINPVTGRIHPGWRQNGTDTGRLACREPNMQNIPRPDPDIPNFRNLFPAKDGYQLITADYSQQEPRIAAQLSGDPMLINACKEDDVYIALGEYVYGERMTKEDPRRQLMKTGVLAALYGGQPERFIFVAEVYDHDRDVFDFDAFMEETIRNKPDDSEVVTGKKKDDKGWKTNIFYKVPGTLAERMGISRQEAVDFYDTIRHKFPKGFAWGDNQIRELYKRGVTQTRIGRICKFSTIKDMSFEKAEKKFANEARNYPVQGTAADMLKLASVYFWLEMLNRGFDATIVIQVHDEIVVEVRDDQAEAVAEILETCMVRAGQELLPDVTTPLESKVDKHWAK